MERKVIVNLQDGLYIVEREDKKLVECECGYSFGDYKKNWKLKALVYERDPSEIYPHGYRAGDKNIQIFREFYCPGCGSQLDVEAVPHGFPFLFNVELDLT